MPSIRAGNAIQEAARDAEEKGLKRGLEKGLEQGLDQGIKKVAQAMKASGLSVEIIVQTTGLTPDEIAAL